MALHLKIITPSKVVIDEDADSVTAPSADGEITVLPRHAHLLSLLKEGIITVRRQGKNDSYAIGGGYLETEGKELTILVSRAYHQDEIDEKLTQQAIEDARKVLSESKDEKQRIQATSILHRSLIDMKLIRRKHRS